MAMNTPEIEELKLLIEQKYGKTLSTTTDFEEFSVSLGHKTGQSVSPSTLKRLWGYVNDSHKPRIYTLNILAQYLGHVSFDAFVSWLKTSTRYNSSFFNAKQLISSELDAGMEVEIGWSPNRLVRLRYLGDSRYEVESSQNKQADARRQLYHGMLYQGSAAVSSLHRASRRPHGSFFGRP